MSSHIHVYLTSVIHHRMLSLFIRDAKVLQFSSFHVQMLSKYQSCSSLLVCAPLSSFIICILRTGKYSFFVNTTSVYKICHVALVRSLVRVILKMWSCSLFCIPPKCAYCQNDALFNDVTISYSLLLSPFYRALRLTLFFYSQVNSLHFAVMSIPLHSSSAVKIVVSGINRRFLNKCDMVEEPNSSSTNDLKVKFFSLKTGSLV